MTTACAPPVTVGPYFRSSSSTSPSFPDVTSANTAALLGCRCFRVPSRRGRIMKLYVGNLSYDTTEDVLRSVEALERAVSGARGLESGSLRMGSIDAASIYVLPELYQEFHERYPGVTMEIVVDDSRALLEALGRGETELATTALPVEDAALVAREIYRDREADSMIATRPAQDRGVDADQSSLRINKRAAGVSGIYGRIGLYEILIIKTQMAPPRGADHSHGHGLTHAKGISNGQDDIANLD